MAVQIFGNQSVQWGVSGQITGMGIVQSMRDSQTGKEVEVADEDGETATLILFDDRQELTAEVVVTSGSVPSRGDLVSGGALVNAIVINFERNYANNDVLKGTLSLRKYANF